MTTQKKMLKKGINLAKLISNYKEGWVSISSDETKVIAWGKTLGLLSDKLKRLNYPKGILLKVYKDYSGYAG